MPLYDYYCESCHKTTELLQKINDPIATECPHCHQPHLKKQVSAAGFQLKGNGWYVTDFKNNKPKEPSQKSENQAVAETPKETPVATVTDIKKTEN